MDSQQWLEWRISRLAFRLNLNDSQKAQARSIFEQAQVSSLTLRQEAEKTREELAAAVKGNRADLIASLSTRLGGLTGKIRAIQATAYADFYNNVLTAAQREEADQMGGPGFGFGGRGMCGRGAMNCPMGARP